MSRDIKKGAKKRDFLKNIHYFRAFAIVNIVIVHIWRIPEIYKEYNRAIYSFVSIAREVIFHDSTIYFIFISGFLFHHLSPAFELKKYYKNKILNVVFPYLFITILILIFKNINFSDPSLSLDIPFERVAETLLYGKAQIQFWYIPFIVIIFLFSPIILKIPERLFPYIFIFSSILPLLGTRTDTRISIFQYVYFFPIYLQGVWASKNYSKFLSLIRINKTKLIFIAIFSTLILIYLSDNSYCFGLININESFYYLQKISVTFLVIIAFKNIEHKNISILNILATYSFSIFFIHFLIGNSYFMDYYFNLIPNSSFFLLTASISYIIIVIFLTLTVSMGVKKLLGVRSRFFIGA